MVQSWILQGSLPGACQSIGRAQEGCTVLGSCCFTVWTILLLRDCDISLSSWKLTFDLNWVQLKHLWSLQFCYELQPSLQCSCPWECPPAPAGLWLPVAATQELLVTTCHGLAVQLIQLLLIIIKLRKVKQSWPCDRKIEIVQIARGITLCLTFPMSITVIQLVASKDPILPAIILCGIYLYIYATVGITYFKPDIKIYIPIPLSISWRQTSLFMSKWWNYWINQQDSYCHLHSCLSNYLLHV